MVQMFLQAIQVVPQLSRQFAVCNGANRFAATPAARNLLFGCEMASEAHNLVVGDVVAQQIG